MMLKKLLALMIFASVPMLAMGCTSDEERCLDQCEATAACSDALDAPSCNESCVNAAKMNEAAGCESLYSDVVSCRSALNACEVNNHACQDESVAHNDCIQAYCAANPGAFGCWVT